MSIFMCALNGQLVTTLVTQKKWSDQSGVSREPQC